MRVALAQTDMVWEDKKESIQKAEKMVSEAAKSKADIIIFPEMSFTGFSMNLEKIGEKRDFMYEHFVKKIQYCHRFWMGITS